MVEANILAASREPAIGKVMNIAGGSRVPLQQVLQLLSDIAGTSISITHTEQQPGDVIHTYADTSLAKAILDYHPLVSLHSGLQDEFRFVQSLLSRSVLPS